MNWLLTQIILLTVPVTSQSSDVPSVYVCARNDSQRAMMIFRPNAREKQILAIQLVG